MFKKIAAVFRRSGMEDEARRAQLELGAQISQKVATDERPVVRFGVLTLLIGFGGFMIWSALAPLDEGVPGTGVVSVDSKRKTIQHLKGGIVQAIDVREGDKVKSGDVLLRLNDTDVKTQLDIVRGRYFTFKAAEARLLAERAGAKNLTFAPELLEFATSDHRAAEAMRAQTQLFNARRQALASELGSMDEAITGLGEQISGLQSIEAGKKTQISLLEKELKSMRELADEGFVPRNKLLELERVLADLSGTRGSDLAQIARAKANISEMKLRKSQRTEDFRKELEKEMAEIQREVGSQRDQLVALSEELARTVVRAPTDGYVVALETHTLGGVIRPGDRIMDIVPEGDRLIIEAQLPVNLIDKVHVGQPANIHLQIVLAGGAQPTIEGKVVQVSADRLTDPRTGMPYYSSRIQITPKGEATLAQNKITPQPGMQADVVVVTGERTVLQYLMRPIMSRLNMGMKEL